MTYRIAHSLGADAANRQMRQEGRTVWNEEDYNLAAATLNKYFPLCVEHPGIDPQICGCARCASVQRPPQQQLLFRS